MEYTADLFSRHIPVWQDIFSRFTPKEAIEIGSYEGRSAEWLLDNIPDLKLTCIDTWDGAGNDGKLDAQRAEDIFDEKVGNRVTKIKCRSGKILRVLRPGYDLIYIDGNHTAAAVLEDMVLAFGLLNQGGLMICDDYIGGWGRNPLDFPKMAIDAFVNCYQDKIDILLYPAYQIYIVKK